MSRKAVGGGRRPRRDKGQRRVVSVAGYPALATDVFVIVTLLAIPDAGRFQEISLWPAAGKER